MNIKNNCFYKYLFIFTTLILLSSLFLKNSFAYQVIPHPENSERNLSNQYEQLYPNADQLWSIDSINNLKKYKIIFIPGFLSNSFVDLGNSQIDFTSMFVQYFDTQMAWLDEIGVDNLRLKIESEAAPGKNAETLLKILNKTDLPVIIVAHSKGGLDLQAAYLKNSELFTKKIAGVITLQSPFFGSPVADWVVSDILLDLFATFLLKNLGGSRQSLISLTTENRYKYNKQNISKFKTMVESVPFINYSSWQPNYETKVDTILEVPRNIMLEREFPSDGLVPWDSAILPKASFVVEKDVDHGATVMPMPFQTKLNRRQFFKTLLYLLMEKIDSHK